MSQTVIGFFKDDAEAQQAVQRLESKGISRDRVDVSRGEYLDATADRDGRNTNRVTDFFNKLFGHESDDAKRYSTIGQTNVTIVTVHASSKDLAEEAADVLDDCGAIDVDEHTPQSEQRSGHSRSADADDFDTARSSNQAEQNLRRRTGMSGEMPRWRSLIIARAIDENDRLR